MNDYSTLAERLRDSGREEELGNVDKRQLDPGAFFEEVKARIIEEIDKANAELQKRRLAPIERVLVPCYLGRLCLTFGTVLMCCVEFDTTRGQINSVIFGPPNRRELSRKEFPLPGGTRGPEAVAADVVSEILESGIRLTQKRNHHAQNSMTGDEEPHFAEFWISLTSLLRSYTAMHSSNGSHQAEIESAGHTITVRQAEKCLILKRHHAIVTWTRENGESGALEFTDHGTLRSDAADEAMDMVAEQWARELMHRAPLVQIRN